MGRLCLRRGRPLPFSSTLQASHDTQGIVPAVLSQQAFGQTFEKPAQQFTPYSPRKRRISQTTARQIDLPRPRWAGESADPSPFSLWDSHIVSTCRTHHPATQIVDQRKRT